jgi:hypothetical protein
VRTNRNVTYSGFTEIDEEPLGNTGGSFCQEIYIST